MKSYPYPIPTDAIEEFTVPVSGHPLSRPMVWEGETIAGNGYVCVRCHIGRWLAGEFPAAPSEFMARVNALPWGRFGNLPVDGWHDLGAVVVAARSRGQIAMRHPLTAKVQPSPVWHVGPVAARLSVLMAVAKLPRVEVAWDHDRESPIWFRFSGGRGIIAADRSLAQTAAARSLFKPRVNQLTGAAEPAKQPAPKPSWGLPGWPPADLSES
jgi:hypothetical protein